MTRLSEYQERALRSMLRHFLDLQELRRQDTSDLQDQDKEERNANTIALQAPTGSGKTLLLLTFSCLLLQRRQIDGVLILTPTQDIRGGFCRSDVVDVPVSDTSVGTHPFSVPLDKWVDVAGLEVSELLVTFLKSPPRKNRRDACGVLVATHAGATTVFRNPQIDLKEIDLSRVAVVIDEAHHLSEVGEDECGETVITKFVETCRRQGALILLATATPFRADGRKICPEYARIVNIAYDEIEGAPSQIHIDLVGPREEGSLALKAATKKELEGEGTRWAMDDADIQSLTRRMLKDAQGRPHEMKCFLKVPRVLTDPRLERALQEAGFRVFDATGPDKAAAFQRLLAGERNVQSFQDSKYDVLLICGRGVEGTDWPLCHRVYHVGLCQSIPRIQQLLGRALRPKHRLKDYPRHLKDTGGIVFFAPDLDTSVSDEIRDSWHSRALLVACFIQDHEVARRFVPHVDLRIRRVLEEQGVHGHPLNRLMGEMAHLHPNAVEMVEAQQDRLQLHERLRHQLGRDPTAVEMTNAIWGYVKSGPWSGPKWRRKAISILLTLMSGDMVDKASMRFTQEILQQIRGGQAVLRDFCEKRFLAALLDTAAKFNHLTTITFEEWTTVQARILGKDVRTIAEDLKRRIVVPTYAQVCKAVDQWYRDRVGIGKQVQGDLSPYLSYPPNTYTATMMKRDLKAQALKGQPEEVDDFHSFLRSRGHRG